MSSKRIFLLLGVVAVLSIAAYIIFKPGAANSALIVPVREGDFLVKVSTTGEIKAKTKLTSMHLLPKCGRPNFTMVPKFRT